jgi:glycosyltransferase involved in cell wall biosynthesis
LYAHPGKKINIVAPDLAAGGMTRAYALGQALAHAGYEVEIFGVRLSPGSLYPLPPSNLKVTQVRGWSRLYCLLKLVMKLDGDIVYAIKPRLSSYGVALLKRWLSRSPVVLDIDDWEMAELEAGDNRPPVWHAPGGFARRARDRLRQGRRWLNPADKRYVRWMDRSIGRADAITVDTRMLQEVYGGTYVPQCKDHAKYDPDRYEPEESRRRYGLSTCIVLMFPGTARPHKGLEDVLLALDILQKPGVKLVIVGGRSSSEVYIAQLMQRWPHWIVRLPAFPQEQMPAIVAAAHVILVPQRDTVIARAQFPMKLTDAMAMGKPVITTTVGDIPEIVGECGYLVPPSSPEQLALALGELLADPQTALERGRAARQRFVENYSLDAVAPVLSGIMQALV